MKSIVVVLFASVILTAAGQEPAEAPKPQRQPPVPKNLKILPPNDLIPTMRAYGVALGVECTECHVKGNFASDDNPKKDVARRMILMTREINAKFTDARTHVTCFTCHRGATEPLMTPAAAGKTGG